MPANNQPGTDWPAIRKRLEAGETARAVSSALRAEGSGPSHTAILKRAKREGWLTETNGPAIAGVPVSKAVYETSTALRMADPVTRGDKLLASLGKRTPETAERIINLVSEGVSPSVAAQAAGISPATLSTWRDDDQGFDDLIKAARGDHLAKMQQEMPKAAFRGDWKAADRVLQVAPETREEYRQSGGQGSGGITVVINTGPANSSSEPVTIDITPR